MAHDVGNIDGAFVGINDDGRGLAHRIIKRFQHLIGERRELNDLVLQCVRRPKIALLIDKKSRRIYEGRPLKRELTARP